jgi:homoserine O-succinyltransferase/O-acetyltransferase
MSGVTDKTPGFLLQDSAKGVGEPMVVGFVNNMPDAALRTTERQFRELLSAATEKIPVRLRFFSLPDLPRSEAGRQHINEHYEDIAKLWTSEVDGLIVTGTEPRAPELRDEPYWNSLATLIEWAENHTVSTVWSCLAAHAAALEIDGISRRLLPQKLSGVFDTAKAVDHPILSGTPARWRVPHSRHNELPEEALVANGYCIVSRSPEAGADIFIKQRKSLFVFVQGHPEYDPEALLREYRRDIGRYLSRERETYPEMPRGYFDDKLSLVLADFRQQALHNREIDLLEKFPIGHGEGNIAHAWLEPAVKLYANWLSYLAERKSQSRWPNETVVTARNGRDNNRIV